MNLLKFLILHTKNNDYKNLYFNSEIIFFLKSSRHKTMRQNPC